MQFQDSNVPTDAQALVDLWVQQGGYKSLDEWMRDSDYGWSHNEGEWTDETGEVVDPYEQALAAMEADNGPLWQAFAQ